MADALTTITKLGIVWKFFERVESVLTDQTKLKIARWLRVKTFETVLIEGDMENWTVTFARVFDQVFGDKHLTWRCFGRSCIMSLCGVAFIFALWGSIHPDQLFLYIECNPHPIIEFIPSFFIISAIPDYLSLLKSRLLIKIMGKVPSFGVLALIALDFAVALSIAISRLFNIHLIRFSRTQSR
jgi:hypothetical protein